MPMGADSDPSASDDTVAYHNTMVSAYKQKRNEVNIALKRVKAGRLSQEITEGKFQ